LAEVLGDETETIGNARRSSVRSVRLFTVSDDPVRHRGVLRWDLFHLDGRLLLGGRVAVVLSPGKATRHRDLNFAAQIAEHGRDALYLRIALEIGAGRVSEETVFLSPPRYLALPKTRAAAALRMISPTRARIAFTSPVFQHRFVFYFSGTPHRASDNYFELYPRETKTIEVEFDSRQRAPRLRRRLVFHSLADSY
jgi:beta-mannosidase